ncbi:MAG: acyltransferase family protein [Bacteroidia bacterium]|nr:acyltransferase family protein [Bacteroidia bacterium]
MARTLLCLLVVLVHVNFTIRPAISSWWPGGFFFAPFFSVLVPVFLILSGFFAVSASSPSTSPLLSTYLLKKVRRLILPFMAWNIILLFLEGFICYPFTLLMFFYLATGFWQLYYLFVLMQLLLVHRLIFRFAWIGNHMRVLVITAGGLSLLYYAAANWVLWTQGASSTEFETYYNRIFIPWGFFFFLGVWFRFDMSAFVRLMKYKKHLVIVSAISYTTYIWAFAATEKTLGFNPLGQFLFPGFFFQTSLSLLMLVLLYQWQRSGRVAKLRDCLARWSVDSYGIYLAHTSVIIVLIRLYDTGGIVIPFCLEVPSFWVVSWMIARALVHFCRHRPWQKVGLILFGNIPTHK